MRCILNLEHNNKIFHYITNFLTQYFDHQVQLLVSDADVESYKQIKADLDLLRQSVEKSELWVFNKGRAVLIDEHISELQHITLGYQRKQKKDCPILM